MIKEWITSRKSKKNHWPKQGKCFFNDDNVDDDSLPQISINQGQKRWKKINYLNIKKTFDNNNNHHHHHYHHMKWMKKKIFIILYIIMMMIITIIMTIGWCLLWLSQFFIFKKNWTENGQCPFISIEWSRKIFLFFVTKKTITTMMIWIWISSFQNNSDSPKKKYSFKLL